MHEDYIVHTKLVYKRETNMKSTNMEKDGYLWGLLYLQDKIDISHFYIDAHTQIKAMMS